MSDLREKAQALVDLWGKRGSREATGEEIADMAEQECQLYRELRAALAADGTVGVAPIGWLYRGGGSQPPEDKWDAWSYSHGPERPFISWTHQEVMPVYAAAAAKGEGNE